MNGDITPAHFDGLRVRAASQTPEIVVWRFTKVATFRDRYR